ncbi:MAG TPA: thioredoxin domain-containing protein [Gemmatimonadales bacterium]|nr:thioredoxin domain-containing protein [Gemmatimonadales bacterium]
MNRFYMVLGAVVVAGGAFLWYSSSQRGGPAADQGPVPVVTAADSAFKGYTLGPDSAPVKIVEYVDYECPICAEFGALQFPVIKDHLINTGKVQWRQRDFPLSIHAHSRLAALATQCAGDQGKYWEMVDQLFDNHSWALQSRDPTGTFHGFAQSLGLDLAKYDACVSANTYAGRIQASYAEGEARGVNGTPTLFINGVEYTGSNRTSDGIQAVVDDLLKKPKTK